MQQKVLGRGEDGGFFFFLLVLQLGRQSHSAAWKVISGIFTRDGFVDCKIKGGFGSRDSDL